MLPSLKNMQFKRQIQFQHLRRNHERIDRRHIPVVSVVPQKQRRHMRACIVDKIQLRRAVLRDFGAVRIIILRILLDGVGIVPGRICDDCRIRPDPLLRDAQAFGQTGRIPLRCRHRCQA